MDCTPVGAIGDSFGNIGFSQKEAWIKRAGGGKWVWVAIPKNLSDISGRLKSFNFSLAKFYPLDISKYRTELN